MKGAKGKKCTIGTKCRYGCISSTKTCRIEPSPSAKGFIRRAMELIKKVISKGKGEADKEVLASAKQTAKEGKALGNQGKAAVDRNAQMEQQSGNIAQLRKMKRKDASDPWLQGYLDVMEDRFDQRGQGVPCGQGWISRSKKRSKEKAKTTSKEARKRGAQKARDRAQLKKEIKTAGRVRDLKKSVQERYRKLQSGEIPVEQRARIRSEQGKEVGELNKLVMEQGIARNKRRVAKEGGPKKVDLPTATVVAMSKPRASQFGDDPMVGVKFRFEDGREEWKNFSTRDASFQKLKRGQSYSVSLNRGSGRISNVFDPVESPKPKPKLKKKSEGGGDRGKISGNSEQRKMNPTALEKLPRTAQIKVKAIARAAKDAGYQMDIPEDGTVNGLAVSKPSSDGKSTIQRVMVTDRRGNATIETYVSSEEFVNTGSRRRVKNKSVHSRQSSQFMGRTPFKPVAETMADFRNTINQELSDRRSRQIETAPLNTKPRKTTYVGAISIDSAQSEVWRRGYHDVMQNKVTA